MEGTYTSPARVERDGVLVAFEGEIMTAEEAAERGLLPRGDDTASVVASAPAEAVGEDGATAETEPKVPTNAEIRAILDERGVAYDKKANKAALLELLATSEQADDLTGDDGSDDAGADDADDLYDDDDEGEDA